MSNLALNLFHEKEQRRFKVKLGVYLLLIQDGQLLMLRRYNTGIDDGLYTVPMGGVDEGETPLQAIHREAQEEANVTIAPENLHLCHAMYRKHFLPDGYFFYQQDLFFKASVYTGEVHNNEPHKADDLRFFALDNLPANIVKYIPQVMKCIKEGRMYSEFVVKPPLSASN